jgi:hypothetical protein
MDGQANDTFGDIYPRVSLPLDLVRSRSLVHLLLLFSALAIHQGFAKLGQLNNL